MGRTIAAHRRQRINVQLETPEEVALYYDVKKMAAEKRQYLRDIILDSLRTAVTAHRRAPGLSRKEK